MEALETTTHNASSDEDSLELIDRYLRELSNLDLLSQERVVELAGEIQAGTTDFREAVTGIPGTAVLAFEHWEGLRRQGRVTGSWPTSTARSVTPAS